MAKFGTIVRIEREAADLSQKWSAQTITAAVVGGIQTIGSLFVPGWHEPSWIIAASTVVIGAAVGYFRGDTLTLSGSATTGVALADSSTGTKLASVSVIDPTVSAALADAVKKDPTLGGIAESTTEGK